MYLAFIMPNLIHDTKDKLTKWKKSETNIFYFSQQSEVDCDRHKTF